MDGAVLIETSDAGTTVTSVVASGDGRLAGTTVQQVAQQLGVTQTGVQDVAPVDAADSAGTGLFYLLVLCTMGAYLSVSALFQAFPLARKRTRVLAAIGASILTPVVWFSALSFSLGGFGARFGELAGLLGTAMIYTLVVSLMALFFNELLGRVSVFAVVIFCLAGNLPGSGGSIPGSLLPPFWAWINSAGFGSAAMEAFQSIIYFDGSGTGDPLGRLLVWLGAAAAAVVLLYVMKARKARKPRKRRSDKLDTRPEQEVAVAIAAGA